VATPYTDVMSSSLRDLSFLWLEITPKCNLECVHCYADSGPQRPLGGDMSASEWLTVLRESADLGCREVQFIGGEPTLHPDLPSMISFASAQGYGFIEVFTNATKIDDRLLETFVKYGVHVATSFYSDDPVIHELVTKRRGSYDRTVANIERMLTAGLPLRAGIIETDKNAGHAQRAMLFLERLGVSNIRVDFQRGIGRGAGTSVSGEPMAELCGECWKGKLCVIASGKVYPCVFSRFADMGNAKDGIGTVLSDGRLMDFRVRLRRYRREEEAKQVGAEARRDCNPRCSPCSPDEFRECRPANATGCDPTCSPCGPGVFKCAPGRCAPRSSRYSSEPLDSTGPPCSPDSSDCGPDHFKACHPRSART
jgi:MoaA/NifB/PqqE/SkfB family radical SAM enzyme